MRCGGILSSRSSRQEPRMYSLIAKAQKRRPCAQGSRACVRNKHPKSLPLPHVGSVTVEKSLPLARSAKDLCFLLIPNVETN